MEPPVPDVPGRAGPAGVPGLSTTSPISSLPPVSLAAGVGAAVLLLTSSGDGLLLAVLVGLATADSLAGAVVAAGVLGALARFGSTSLPAIAGAQAVLGPAVAVGPLVGALGSLAGGLACVAVAPRDPVRAGLVGAAGGVVAFAPSMAGGPADAVLRLAGLAAGAGLAVLARRVPEAPRRWAAAALGALGLVLSVVA